MFETDYNCYTKTIRDDVTEYLPLSVQRGSVRREKRVSVTLLTKRLVDTEKLTESPKFNQRGP